MPESNPLQPGQKFGNGRFVLVRFLGSGGMGEVWLAQDERLRESVALKFLPAAIRGDAKALDGLRRETARSHQLSHVNIIRIHDLHEDADGTTFIVMEYIDGPTLAALQIEQPNQVFHWDYLRPLLEQLCVALDYAHGEKVIHRDLKPANLMVDGRGRLKLADFGLAALVSDSINRASAHHPGGGTVNYMSPQQLTGKRAQPTDDIYALGATFYELLTSQMPFHTGELTHQVLHEPPEPMEERLAALQIQNEIPPDMAALVMACLAKEPEKRPQSALAVAEWIGLEVVRKPSLKNLSNDVFAGAPEIEAPAPVPPGSGKKSLWAAGVLAALVLLALGGWYWAKQMPHKHVQQVLKADAPAAAELNWIPLFNGLTLSGWKSPDGGKWKVEDDGSIVSKGPRSHLFSPKRYTNLEFKAEIKLSRGANGGMYFRTEFVDGKVRGYEAQAYNGDGGMGTGSLVDFKEASEQAANDETWFVQHVIAIGNHIVIKVNDTIVVNCLDGENTHTSGHLALQHWEPPAKSTTWYRNVMVKPLPDDEAAAWAEARKDMPHLRQ